MHHLTGLLTRLAEPIRSLPLSAALLDPDGTIHHVNAEWRNFGASNGFRCPNGGIGLNYFDFCTSEHARELRALVLGRRNFHTYLYPCHSPDKARWMALAAVPLTFTPPSGLMMLHFNLMGLLSAEVMGVRLIEAPVSEASFASFMRVLGETISQVMAVVRMERYFINLN
jgi:hypothetical protein